MDRHTVGTEVAKMAMAIITRDGWASAKTLAAAIPCDRRTAGRIIALFKAEGLVVKSGYGVEPRDSAAKIRPHSDTDQHSATSSSMAPEMSTTFGHNIRTSRDSATTSGHIRPSQLLNHSKTVQNEDGLGRDDELPTEASVAVDGPCEQKDIEEPVAIAARAASATDDEEQQPWGPDENEQASLDYQEWLVRKHTTTEITDPGGADAQHRSSCDGLISGDPNLAVYHADLDKLIGILSRERAALKLANRQLGKKRGLGKITRAALHRGKKDHSNLLRVVVGLEADRASGELRYANLQAAGETLDIVWGEWRQKMAMDPEEVRHYQEMIQQAEWDARKEAREERRLAKKKEQIKAMPPAPAAGISMPEPKPTIDPEPAHEHTDEEDEDPEVAWREASEDQDPTAYGTYGYAPISVPKTNTAPTPAPSAASSDPVQEPVEEAVSPVVPAPKADYAPIRDDEYNPFSDGPPPAPPLPAALEPASEPAAPTVTSEFVQEVSEAVSAPEPVPATLEERILAILASAGCRTRDQIIIDLGVNKWDAIGALNGLLMKKKIIGFGRGIPEYRLARKEVNV